MHTVNNLFEKIIDKENILLAIHNAAKGKKKKRVVRYTLANEERIAEMLHNKLANKTWRPNPCHNVKTINDGINLKKREIVCPDFINEQVVHHAIMQVLKPVLIKRFYRYSCASIPDRGVEYAVKYIRKAVKDYKATKYFTVLDIRKFFNSLRSSKVFHLLRRIIRDKQTLMLLAYILRANKITHENGEKEKRGCPIGFYTSPWFANLVLTPLDNIIKESGIKYYIRYNDDMLLFSSNKRKLKQVILQITNYLKTVCLSLKKIPQIHLLSKVCIRFIGTTISREKVVLAPRIFLRAKRVANRIHKKGFITVYDARRIVSYSGRFKHLDTRQAYIRYIESKVSHRRCRQIISKGEKDHGMDKRLFKGKTSGS